VAQRRRAECKRDHPRPSALRRLRELLVVERDAQMMHAESEGRTKQAAASSVSPPVCDPQMLVGPLLF